MYKVFIREVPVIICNYQQIKADEKGLNIVRFEVNFDWEKLTEYLIKDVFIVGNDVEIIWSSFKQMFTEISAAGGVVENTKGEILCIFRNGKWDLPKGKVEQDEAIEEAAIREVEEECGVEGLSLQKAIENTYHTYEVNGVQILKTTYWFAMKTDYEKLLVPQLEEGITKVEWINKAGLEKVKTNTYRSILELFSNLQKEN